MNTAVKTRDTLLKSVTKAYFARRKLQVDATLNPPDDVREEALVGSCICYCEPEFHYAVGDPLPILYQQPVVLLAFFGIITRQSFLISNWPYSYDSLKMVISAMGLSEDVLYA